MGLDRTAAEVQLGRDGLVAQSFGDEFGDLPFACGQLVEFRGSEGCLLGLGTHERGQVGQQARAAVVGDTAGLLPHGDGARNVARGLRLDGRQQQGVRLPEPRAGGCVRLRGTLEEVCGRAGVTVVLGERRLGAQCRPPLAVQPHPVGFLDGSCGPARGLLDLADREGGADQGVQLARAYGGLQPQ